MMIFPSKWGSCASSRWASIEEAEDNGSWGALEECLRRLTVVGFLAIMATPHLCKVYIYTSIGNKSTMRHYEGNNYGHETTQVDDDEVQFIASSSSKAEDSMESWTCFFGFYIYIMGLKIYKYIYIFTHILRFVLTKMYQYYVYI